MAVDKILLQPPTNNLAHAEKKGFYPLRIPVSHWQLRHYISTPEPDLLYYASGHDIYCLNTASMKRKHIATLPFEARCTASGFGYVCVGGEVDGHFAAIKLDGSGPRTLDVDSALPIDSSAQQWRRQSSDGAGRRAASVKVERIGDEIVNSISIHRIQDEEAHLDDIVAVLTNNDKTVRVYSLPGNVETTVLDLPFPMNHATVSPDGQTMVAVGDINQAYFFQREIQQTPPQIHKPHNRLTSASIEWTLTSIVPLHASEQGMTQCYFTTAWSPSGRLVAVGSEGGYITVFDIDLLYNPDLLDDEAIVTIIPGSRPDVVNPHPGAVRSMMFSPEPWDLLIWAEDQGRVCIGDLRTGLKSRQIVTLEPKDENLRRIAYVDVPSDDTLSIDELEADFIQRYRQAPATNTAAVNFATEYIEARRRQRQQRSEMASMRSQLSANRESRESEQAVSASSPSLLEDDPRGLTAREQQILDSLRLTRQREEARAAGRGVNYTSAEMFARDAAGRLTGVSSAGTGMGGGGETTSGSATTASGRPISEILSSVPDSFPELSRTNTNARPSSSHGLPESQRDTTLPPFSSLQAGEGSRDWGTIRLSDGSRLPRRRASVILTPPTTTSASSSSALPIAITATNQGPPTPSNRAEDEAEENPWRTIEEHMRLERGPLFESTSNTRGPPSSSTRHTFGELNISSTNTLIDRDLSRRPPTESELQAELATERARARSLARQRERWRRLPTTSSTSAAAAELGTAVPTAAQASAASQGYNDLLIQRARIQMQMRGGYSGREVGVRTAGLAMSEDGGWLWVACEEGIYEIEMNLKGRMFVPAVEPR